MMVDANEYLSLVTSEHRDKPKFIAMLTSDVAIPIKVQEILGELTDKFDVGLAVGQQLDVIGEWVGVSRRVSIPIANVYFSWDGADPSVGWDYGTWQPSDVPTTITSLPDDAYRMLIRAKIASNNWNGTTPGAYAIWGEIFPDITILIQDRQDMTYDMAIVGGLVDSLTSALLTKGYIPLRPEGVKVNKYFIPVNDGPLFGWDLDSEFVSGWDEGSWAQDIAGT